MMEQFIRNQILQLLMLVMVGWSFTALASGPNFNDTTSKPLVADSSGNVGIGTSSPLAAFDTNEFRLSTNPAAGYVLVSGSTGIGTWMAPGTLPISGGSSGWSTGTGTVYNTTGSDKVGIGTSTPQGGFVVTNGNVGIGTWTPAGAFVVANGNVGIGSIFPQSFFSVLGAPNVTSAVVLRGGAGTGNTSGGGLSMTGGAGSNGGNGGGITLTGGVGGSTSGTGGSISITSGSSAGAGSGNISLAIGNSTSSSVAQGSFSISGGNATNVSGGGTISFTSGTYGSLGSSSFTMSGSGSITASTVTLSGGSGASLNGGSVTISSGSGGNDGSTHDGGALTLSAGSAQNSGVAGNVAISAGSSSSGNAKGGDVFIIPGANSGTGVIGNVLLGVSSSATYRGNVGIGTIYPLSKFVVTSGGIAIGTNRNNNFIQTAAPSGGLIVENNIGVGTNTPQAALAILGNVGLGTWTAATARLDTDGFRLSTGPAAGYVLVSGSTGIGTWMAPGTLTSGGAGSPSGNDRAIQYNSSSSFAGDESKLAFDGTNVGIGTIYPGSILTVAGGVGIGTNSNSSYIRSSAPAGSMFIEGNIGIGTIRPGIGLQINNKYIFANRGYTIGYPYINFEHTYDISNASPIQALTGGADTIPAYSAAVNGNLGGKNYYSLIGMRTRNTTGWSGTFSAVTTGDYLPGIGFAGQSDTGTTSSSVPVSASIVGYVDGTVSTGVLPTALVFHTSPTNSSGMVDRLRITSGGNIGINTLTPKSMLTVAGGGVGVGTNYNSSFIQNSAPNGFLIVEGNVGIGTYAPIAALDTSGIRLSTNPAAGYVLVSDTTGIGTWMAPGTLSSGGSSQWTTTNTNDVYLPNRGNVGLGTTFTTTSALTVMNGNVGIGTWIPGAPLSINSGISNYSSAISAFDVGGAYMTIGDKNRFQSFTSNMIGIKFFDANVSHASMIYDSSNNRFDFCYSSSSGGLDCNGTATSLTITTTNDAGHVAVSRYTNTPHNTVGLEVFKYGTQDNFAINSSSVLGDLFIVKNAGNVGIGTNVPGSLLSVAGGVGIGTGFNSTYVSNAAPSGGLIVQTNIGIGTIAPQTALSVLGNVGLGTWTAATARLDTDGFRLSTNPAAGYVLVSDTTGIGTWMAPGTLTSGGAGSPGGSSSQLQYNNGGSFAGITNSNVTASGNVGLGTTLSANKLDVSGGVGIGSTYAGYTTAPSNGLIVQGNVGIGSSAPQDQLSVVVNANGNAGTLIRNTNAGGSAATQLVLMNNSGNYAQLFFGSSAFSNVNGANRALFASTTGFGFLTNNTVATSGADSVNFFTGGYSNMATMTIRPGNPGNVGIGTIFPGSALSVAGGVGIGTGYNTTYVSTAAPSGGLIVQGNVGIGTHVPTQALDVNGKIAFSGSGNSYFLGNVGVGSSAPGSTLDVAGTARVTGMQLTTNPSAGYVLVSGSTGIGTWMAPGTLTSGGSSQFTTVNTNDVYLPNNGNIGIGTSSTQTSLTVLGNVGVGTWTAASRMNIAGGLTVGSPAYLSTTALTGSIFASGNLGIGTYALSNYATHIIKNVAGTVSTLAIISGGSNFVPGSLAVEHTSPSANYGGVFQVGSLPSDDTIGGIHVVGGGSTKNNYALVSVTGVGATGVAAAAPPGRYVPGIGFAVQTSSTAGSDMVMSASINAVVDNPVSSQVGPLALVFHTSPNKASGLTERMRITSGGNIGMGTTIPAALFSVVGNIGISTVAGTSFATTSPPIGGMIAEGNVGIGTTVVASKLAVKGAYTQAVIDLSDAASVATNAALGNHFRLTTTQNFTLSNPTNATDGQRVVWEIIQDGSGNRTITLDTKFALGADIASVTLTTTGSKRDFLTAIYNVSTDKWYVVGFVKGY